MACSHCCSAVAGGITVAIRRPSPTPRSGGEDATARPFLYRRFSRLHAIVARASYGSSADFSKRIEQAWIISQQPRPIVCSSCDSNGHVECKWCGGTGFFILGNNMLCEVPSKNTNCLICIGKGSTWCSDCKGSGFRAKWLGEPPPHR